MWNAAQRLLNSRRYRHEGSYLPMRIIDHGSLSGYISMNRAWAGFDFEDYYRASRIAMGMLDDELEADLESEYLPEGGRRIGGLADDHGIAQIARELTAAEQEIKDELEGRAVEAAESQSKEDAVRAFQVVSGDMFSRMHDRQICGFPSGGADTPAGFPLPLDLCEDLAGLGRKRAMTLRAPLPPFQEAVLK